MHIADSGRLVEVLVCSWSGNCAGKRKVQATRTNFPEDAQQKFHYLNLVGLFHDWDVVKNKLDELMGGRREQKKAGSKKTKIE